MRSNFTSSTSGAEAATSGGPGDAAPAAPSAQPPATRFAQVAPGGALASSSVVESPSTHIPTHYYNVVADLPVKPAPMLNPKTHEPVKPEDLAPLFGSGLIKQELSTERYIEIPGPVREAYATYRPTPFIRATGLERAIGTRSRIYFKFEGASPLGSHKLNSSLAQAYYNKLDGVKKLTTETGAGQWGAALAYAGARFGLDVEVFQVRASYDQKPYRRYLMETYGATVHASPSERTQSGRRMREKFPDTTGSLGMAISEAVEVAATSGGTAHYALGSVLNQVLLHQSVIGQEAVDQLRQLEPRGADAIFGCVGGGSNFGGLAFPFLREALHGHSKAAIVAAEPLACPSITKGEFRYDFGDVAGLTPLMKMYTLGRDFVPSPIHAGGLRYHGMSPLLSHAVHEGYIKAVSVGQLDTFAAGVLTARAQGILPAPESTHAIAAALDYLRHEQEPKVVVIGVSGHGQLDLPAYEQYLHGQLKQA